MFFIFLLLALAFFSFSLLFCFFLKYFSSALHFIYLRQIPHSAFFLFIFVHATFLVSVSSVFISEREGGKER